MAETVTICPDGYVLKGIAEDSSDLEDLETAPEGLRVDD